MLLLPEVIARDVLHRSLPLRASRPGGLPRLEHSVFPLLGGSVCLAASRCKSRQRRTAHRTRTSWTSRPRGYRTRSPRSQGRPSDLPLLDEFRIKSQMIPQISGDQEVFSHPVVTGATHGLPSIRVAHELDGTVSGFLDRKSTRLNSSHSQISYAVFCLKKK